MAELLQFPLFPSEEDDSPQPALPPDHTARQRALDMRHSCIVEAPAGSGKTGLLLQRFLKLLAEGGVAQPEEVLAITFTRKATAELRERILDQLHQAASAHPLAPDASNFARETRALADAVLALDARLGWGLLDQPQRLRIRTIDSVCADIARTLPLLSGSGALQPVDNAAPLYREAARRTLLQLGGPDAALSDALRTVLLHRDANLEDLERLLARMLEQRQQWGELVPLDAASLSDTFLDTTVRPRLESSLAAIISAGLTRAVDAMPAGVLEELTAIAERLGRLPAYNAARPHQLPLWAGRPTPPTTHADDLPLWDGLLHLLFTKSGDWRRGFNKSQLNVEASSLDKTALQGIIDSIQTDALRAVLLAVRALPPARYPAEQWRVAKALFRLLRHALAELKVLFGETSQCDFAELALAAHQALSGDGLADLASAPGSRLTHLLVDEMQDTSTSQYNLLELLTRSWDGSSQTLFLVGDPKQSIYLFRQARVERFLRTVRERRLGDVPLEPLQLTANFRSQAALVDGFNETFARIFPASANTAPNLGEELEVPFVHADAIRSAASDTPAIHWHTTILGDGDSRGAGSDARRLRARRRRTEALRIREAIQQWCSRPLPPGRSEPWRIAVLTRARHHLTAITTELAGRAGRPPIPYRAVDIDPLSERSEVLDALALTRALLHPADRPAWLAVLRAPWCGLSLTDLLCLTGEGPEADAEATVAELVTSRRDQISPIGRQLLDRAWPILAHAVDTLGRTSLATHVERTWRSLGGDVSLSPEHQANVRTFLTVLRELELTGGGRVDLKGLAARLATLYAEPAAVENAVELLTIHNSKGLEFDLVLVPGLERRPMHHQTDLLNWLELEPPDNQAAHILLAPIWQRGDAVDRLNRWLSTVRRERNFAEVRRLLYVACTRAREELHLFAACERSTSSGNQVLQPRSDTLLGAAWPVAGELFARHQPAGSTPAANPDHTVVTLPPADDDDALVGLALAAAAEHATAPIVHRLPLTFNPLARFNVPIAQRLSHPSASVITPASSFDRPEGSFGVRAFGNVVHRFLQIISQQLERANDPEALLSELAGWSPRLHAALRGEGLAPSHAQREAPRALTALSNALTDPLGRWILSPHPRAANERSLATSTGVLRADRLFLAGPAPLAPGDDTIWIVDFKTTEQGSRPRDVFEQEELLKYRPQLERYASIQRQIADGKPNIQLALFYPLVPCLLQWPAGGHAVI